MTDIHVNAAFCAAVSEVWRKLAPNDQEAQRPGTQDTFRATLERDLAADWRALVEQLRGGLATAPYRVVVRGHGAGHARALLAATAVGIGAMTNPYRDLVAGSPLIQQIVAKGPQSPDQVWKWHTDSANWPVPNDFSALACVRAAPAGGATDLLSLDSMRASPEWDDELLAPLWTYGSTWPTDSFLGGGTFVDRCIGPHRLRYRRELMTGGPAPYRRAVAEFARLADAVGPDDSALLRPGDLVVFDNARTMHRSGPAEDPGRRRLLLRTKIARRATDRPAQQRHV